MNRPLALHIGSTWPGRGKTAPGFLCLGMAVLGRRMGNKSKPPHLI